MPERVLGWKVAYAEDGRVALAVLEAEAQRVLLSPYEVICSVQDEGQGYDPTTLPDPADPANLERVGGRGLLLIRTFMDEVQFSSGGKQITMTKKRETAASKC